MTAKKNWTYKLAGVLLALVLVTSCFVGSTFAKYVRSGSGNDTARVAKFGVTVNAASDMFSKEYAKTDDTFTLDANSVVSSDESKLVAPGTSQTMAEFGLRGTPEVAVRVSYSATLDLGDNWTTNGTDEYCPLIFKVGNDSFKIGDDGIDSVEALENAVNGAVANVKHDYKANTDLSGTTADNLVVSWEWPFESGNDANDTALGDRAAANVADAGVVSFSVTATVTQID